MNRPERGKFPGADPVLDLIELAARMELIGELIGRRPPEAWSATMPYAVVQAYRGATSDLRRGLAAFCELCPPLIEKRIAALRAEGFAAPPESPDGDEGELVFA